LMPLPFHDVKEHHQHEQLKRHSVFGSFGTG